MQQPAFIGPAYQLGSVAVDAQQCINWFPEVNELGTGKNQEVAALVRRPGLKKLATVSPGPCRGMWERTSGGTRHMVSGNKLFDITDRFNPVDKGTLQTLTGPVGMADNGLQLLIVDGLKGYVLTYATGGFHTIADPDFPPATHCAFQDQYLIVNNAGTRQFMVSALSDATDWDTLDFASKEGLPDNITALVSDHRQLILGGFRSTEMWDNTGHPDFPFERNNGAFLEHGLAAGHTLKKFNESVYGVGRSEHAAGMVGRLVGYNPERISTVPLETAIAGYGDLSVATAWAYEWKRHPFYLIDFVGSATTWVYDGSTGLWHERKSMSSEGVLDRWRAQYHVFDGERHLVGDYQNGNLYQLDDDTLTDDGREIFRRRRAPHLSNQAERLVCSRFELDMDVGRGPMPHLLAPDGQPRDPMVMLRVSKDMGKTWGMERWKSAGRAGETRKRVIWDRLGWAYNWTWEVTITDPFAATLISAFPRFS